jgi:two-component system cell cycle response regulator
LRGVAGVLSNVASGFQASLVARLGGDEFVIAMPHVNSIEGVELTAEKVIKGLSQPYNLEGSEVSVTASAGVGLYPLHGKDVNTLLKNADAALLEAKQANKNTYRFSVRVNV